MSDTINSLIEFIEPEYQAVIKTMMEQRGTTGELLITDIPKVLVPNNTRERIALICIQNAVKTKFAPKLTFDQRCEVLALRRAGHTNEIISKMYNIDRRTVTHIYRESSPHYKNVRAHEIGMGRVEFMTKYLTEFVMSRAEDFKANYAEGPNKAANRMRGLHSDIRNDYCSYNHRVIIRWLEASEAYGEAGWYYQDLDGDSPDKWFIAGADKKNTYTSQACYLAMKEEIMDKTS